MPRASGVAGGQSHGLALGGEQRHVMSARLEASGGAAAAAAVSVRVSARACVRVCVRACVCVSGPRPGSVSARRGPEPRVSRVLELLHLRVRAAGSDEGHAALIALGILFDLPALIRF